MATTTDRRQLTLAVEGMTCASCVRRVERALLRVPGVEEAAAGGGVAALALTRAGMGHG
jgi:cation transport ATPase